MPIFVNLIINPKTKFSCLFLILTLMALMIAYFGDVENTMQRKAYKANITTENVQPTVGVSAQGSF